MSDESYEELIMPLHVRFGDAQLIDIGNQAASMRATIAALSAQTKSTKTHSMADAHRDAQAMLRQQLLAHIYQQSHKFFERLIIDVLLRMGYGSRKRDLGKCLGRSHDGGIDGVIMADELGLDAIYLQAKRYRLGTSVPISQVRDFVGSLEAHHAGKGVFVTTAHFTPAAREFIQAVQRRVVLVDGEQLSDIMIRHNIGVQVKETFQFKELHLDYFTGVAGKANSTSPTPV